MTDDTARTTPLATGSISLRPYPHDLVADDTVAVLRRQARAAVEAGYDGLMLAEHHGNFGGYFPNPQFIASLLLPIMPTGWVAPAPILLPLRHYAMLAEQLAWLAACYPGRVGAGFGVGGVPIDFEMLGIPFEEAGARYRAALPKIVAALRGHDPTALGDDRAIVQLRERPMRMVVAAMAEPPVKRAARLGVGILFDSMQTPESMRHMCDLYDEQWATHDQPTGATRVKIAIRRVWVGDPPDTEMAAQVASYRNLAAGNLASTWGSGTNLVHGSDGIEAAEALAATLDAAHVDAVNVRIHVKGLRPEQVDEQLELHAASFLPHLRKVWKPYRAG
jgi:alkanesulfonate monooxygenase SsuD/methylene tetrahydromethanopterin reductase-like flavin-dependent oxidoreductase (luciferase family)